MSIWVGSSKTWVLPVRILDMLVSEHTLIFYQADVAASRTHTISWEQFWLVSSRDLCRASFTKLPARFSLPAVQGSVVASG